MDFATFWGLSPDRPEALQRQYAQWERDARALYTWLTGREAMREDFDHRLSGCKARLWCTWNNWRSNRIDEEEVIILVTDNDGFWHIPTYDGARGTL